MGESRWAEGAAGNTGRSCPELAAGRGGGVGVGDQLSAPLGFPCLIYIPKGTLGGVTARDLSPRLVPEVGGGREGERLASGKMKAAPGGTVTRRPPPASASGGSTAGQAGGKTWQLLLRCDRISITGGDTAASGAFTGGGIVGFNY